MAAAKDSEKSTSGTTGNIGELTQDQQILLLAGFTTDGKRNEDIMIMETTNPVSTTTPQTSNTAPNPLCNIPLCKGVDFPTICEMEDRQGIIVSGGHDKATNRSIAKVQKFSATDRTWVDLPDMPRPCELHGAVCVDNRFITIGGCLNEDGKETRYANVNVLDLNTLIWSEWQPLEVAVTRPGVTVITSEGEIEIGASQEGKREEEKEQPKQKKLKGETSAEKTTPPKSEIIVIGGADGNKYTINSCCSYNTLTGTRRHCRPAPTSCMGFNRTVAASNTTATGKRCNVVFVLHVDACLFMMYNVETDLWSEIPNRPLKPLWYTSMVLCNGSLMVTGGAGSFKGTPVEPAVQTYDIEKEEWSVETVKMPLPLYCHNAVVVKRKESK